MNNVGEERFYRKDMNAPDLNYYNVKIEQSDLFIGTKGEYIKSAKKALATARKEVKKEIATNPSFLTSYYPLRYSGGSTFMIAGMYSAAKAADVGPMAAVAGATAQYVGTELMKFSDEVIVENGGDIFIKTNIERRIMLYAGQSSLSGRLAIKIPPGTWGVCTSAYSVGHSYSEGRCDAAVVMAHDCTLADAVATALGNSIKNERQLEGGILNIMKINGITGALAVINEKIAAGGDISLEPV